MGRRRVLGGRLGARALGALVAALGCGLLLAGVAGGGATKEFRVGVFVKVTRLDDNGRVRPLPDAVVSARPGEGLGTNAAGYAYVRAAASITAGEYVTISAEKDGYHEQKVRVLIDADIYRYSQAAASAPGRAVSYLLNHHSPVITFTLSPDDAPDGIVDLVVQVKDDDLDPVGGALVGLNRTSPPIGPVTHSYTGNDGEARFLVPRTLIEDGLQARVFAGKHGKKFSDVSQSVLNGKGRRIFLVVLSPEQKGCKLAGTWSQTTETVGTTTWTTTKDGKALEAGLGNATGKATLNGSVLAITWTTADAWAGVYRWTLDAKCSGTGTLTFTKGPRSGEALKSTVRGTPP